MEIIVNGHGFKDYKILDNYLYVKCGFGYTLVDALKKSGYTVEIKMDEAELKENYCSSCIHSDGKGNCITKYEAPFDTFVCDNGEMFEENK